MARHFLISQLHQSIALVLVQTLPDLIDQIESRSLRPRGQQRWRQCRRIGGATNFFPEFFQLIAEAATWLVDARAACHRDNGEIEIY